MSPDENVRKLVQPAVWQIFQRYFPEALEYTSIDSACEECLVIPMKIEFFFVNIFVFEFDWFSPQHLADAAGKTKEYHKQMAVDQKALLPELFKHKNRPDPLLIEPPIYIYAVSRQVIDKWRSFVR